MSELRPPSFHQSESINRSFGLACLNTVVSKRAQKFTVLVYVLPYWKALLVIKIKYNGWEVLKMVALILVRETFSWLTSLFVQSMTCSLCCQIFGSTRIAWDLNRVELKVERLGTCVGLMQVKRLNMELTSSSDESGDVIKSCWWVLLRSELSNNLRWDRLFCSDLSHAWDDLLNICLVINC